MIVAPKTLVPTRTYPPPRCAAWLRSNGVAAMAATSPAPWLTLLAISSPRDCLDSSTAAGAPHHVNPPRPHDPDPRPGGPRRLTGPTDSWSAGEFLAGSERSCLVPLFSDLQSLTGCPSMAFVEERSRCRGQPEILYG